MTILKEPSEEFLESLRKNGGCIRDCPHGVTFFDGDNDGSWDWEEGERESLLAKSKVNPEKYRSIGGGPTCARFDGRDFVLDCVLCLDRLAAYEAFLIHSADAVARFYAAYAKSLEEDAAKLRAASNAAEKVAR